MQGLTNRFSYDSDFSDLAFHLSIIKLRTIKPLARPMTALAQGVGQWDLSAPEMYKIIISRSIFVSEPVEPPKPQVIKPNTDANKEKAYLYILFFIDICVELYNLWFLCHCDLYLWYNAYLYILY